jgi:hypothetical protein
MCLENDKARRGEETKMIAQDVPLASTAPTGKPLLTKDPAERAHGRLEKHKMVHVRPSEKITVWYWEGVGFVGI